MATMTPVPIAALANEWFVRTMIREEMMTEELTNTMLEQVGSRTPHRRKLYIV